MIKNHISKMEKVKILLIISIDIEDNFIDKKIMIIKYHFIFLYIVSNAIFNISLTFSLIL